MMLSQWDDPSRWNSNGRTDDYTQQHLQQQQLQQQQQHVQGWQESTFYTDNHTGTPPSPFVGVRELMNHTNMNMNLNMNMSIPQTTHDNSMQQHINNMSMSNPSYLPSPPSTSPRNITGPDLTHLLDLLAHSANNHTSSWQQQQQQQQQPFIQYTHTIQQQQPQQPQFSLQAQLQQQQLLQQQPYHNSPNPLHTPSSTTTSASVSPIPTTSPHGDGRPTKQQKTSHKPQPIPTTTTTPTPNSKHKQSTKTSPSKSKPITPKPPEEPSDSLARRLKHRAIDANRRVRLSAGFDALQAIVAPGESHSQIVLLEKSGELMRHLQSDVASLKAQLRVLKRKRARRERGLLGIQDELSDSEEEKTIVKKEYPINTNRQDRPSGLFGIAHVNYFCDANVMLSCTNLHGVLVDVNSALLRAFHLRAPEDRIGKFTLAPHTISLATSSQPFSQHLSAAPMAYQSQPKPLLGPNPDTTRSPVVDSRTPTGLPSSNVVMRDGTVSAQPGLIKGATTNELVPYLPSVVKLQKLLQGQVESTSIIFEGIDGRGQRYHAKFTLWLLYNSQGKPEYIMAMCNPASMIHFPNDSPPYYTTTVRATATVSISPGSTSSSSSSTSPETSPNRPVVHSPLPVGPHKGDLGTYVPHQQHIQ